MVQVMQTINCRLPPMVLMALVVLTIVSTVYNEQKEKPSVYQTLKYT